MCGSLKILCLFFVFSLSAGHRRVFHFINESNTWEQAQKYCRDHYTDLATVESLAEAKSMCPNTNGCGEAWIGLKSNYSMHWHWSQSQHGPPHPGVKGDGNCVTIKKRKKKLERQGCYDTSPFFCYDDKITDKYVVVEKKKPWLSALRYCRYNHTDLVREYDQIQNDAWGNDETAKWWIGLFRDSWVWSDGSNSSFRNWADENDEEKHKFGRQNNKDLCARLGNTDRWKNVNCSEDHPFICYDDHMVLVQKNMTWEEALVYCRTNHGELAMMTDEHWQRKVFERAKKATSKYVWVGLHFACVFEEWVWVNGHRVDSNDKHWEKRNERPNCDVSGAMQRSGAWVKRPSGEQHNFVCRTKDVCKPVWFA